MRNIKQLISSRFKHWWQLIRIWCRWTPSPPEKKAVYPEKGQGCEQPCNLIGSSKLWPNPACQSSLHVSINFTFSVSLYVTPLVKSAGSRPAQIHHFLSPGTVPVSCSIARVSWFVRFRQWSRSAPDPVHNRNFPHYRIVFSVYLIS